MVKTSRVTGWGASVIGPLHISSNLPNQDSWGYASGSWGEVLCVSDGMGSCKHAQVGSQMACKAAIQALRNQAYNLEQQSLIVDTQHQRPHPISLEQNQLQSSLASLDSIDSKASLGSKFNEESFTLAFLKLLQSTWLGMLAPYTAADCRCTCLLAIHLRRQQRIAVMQLGDGLIAALAEAEKNPDGGVVSFPVDAALGSGEEKEFANVTTGLGDTLHIERWRSAWLPVSNCRAIVLCTDGVADDLKGESRHLFMTDFVASFAHMSKRHRSLAIRQVLTDWPVPKHTDDKTLACLYFKH